MSELLNKTKYYLYSLLTALGLAISTLRQIVTALRAGHFEKREFVTQAAHLVSSSWQSVGAIMLALGVAIGVQLAPEFESRGLGSQMGIVSALTMIRELGPIMGSLMIATQYGSSTAAELSNMKITEQIDALKVFRVNPISFLVIPRFVAAVALFPIINWLASLVGIASTFITVSLVTDIQLKGFMASIWSYLAINDILLCFFKSSVFGALIVVIASSIGLATTGGAREVGRATTTTVIVSFVAIVVVDFVITALYL